VIIAFFIGVGERAARRRVTNAQVIATRSDRAQTENRLAQALAAGELRENHAQELIHA
jgi:hypothetical protein